MNHGGSFTYYLGFMVVREGGGVVCMFCEGSIFLIYLVAINVLIALQFTGQFGMVCY